MRFRKIVFVGSAVIFLGGAVGLEGCSAEITGVATGPDAGPDADGQRDGGAQSDATATDGGNDGGGATQDGGTDANDGGDRGDGGDLGDGGDGGGGEKDAGTLCDQVLRAMLAAPIALPDQFSGLDLSKGSDKRGLTVDEANGAKCLVFDADTDPPENPGYRNAHWGSGDDRIDVTFNMESRVIQSLSVAHASSAYVLAKSRDGAHTYRFAYDGVKKDGAPFAIDWNEGAPHATVNELSDALMATFAKAAAQDPDCVASKNCLFVPDTTGNGSSYVGVRPLHFFMEIKGTTQTVSTIYSPRPGGRTDCTTPKANLERMDYAYIDAWTMGGIAMYTRGAQRAGMTNQEADAIECNGTPVVVSDGNYKGIQWGPSGELFLKYNNFTGVAYQLVAKQGYKGTMTVPSSDGKSTFVIGVGTLTKNGAPFTIDWKAPLATMTELSNAINTFEQAIPADEDDCIAAQDCTYTPDALGNITIDFPNAYITLTFAKGTDVPDTVMTTWPNGMVQRKR